MNPLKPRDKVTQHMTRNGLTLDNQTTGESVNVSSREAEQEYTAQPEGAAEKILERADELHDRHKANQWEAPDEYRHIRSNMVYQMDYSISENTRYDSAAQKSVPYSWTLRWGLYTNAPHGNPMEKIAGQERKVFSSREELDKYLNGRIKAHDHYFTEISPAIPKEYADCFKVNGCLLPGYTIEGEEPAKAAALPTQEEAAQPQQTTATPERREPVNEVFSIFLDNRAEAQTGGPHGYWLSLPTSAEQVQETLKEIHITADNQQDLFIGDFSAPEGKPLELPEDLIKTASVDELNFLAAQLQKLDAVELAELNAVMQSPAKMQTIGQLLDYAENTDCFVLINAKDNRSLGEYYLNDSGLFVVPDPWKPAIDTDRLGSFIANEEQGTFTDYGYILRTSDEWQRVHEGQPVPEEYRVMAYPAPEILREESKVQPEAATPAKAPQPVTPILLNGQNSAERMKEITDRLETGIQELFESERYKAYLTTMSKFHSYSFNNTLLIASPTFPSTKCRPARRGATSAIVPMRNCRRMGFRWTGRITSLSTPRRWTRTSHWTRFTAASTWNIPPITRDIPSRWGILWCSGRMENRPPTMWTRGPTTGRCRSFSPSRKSSSRRTSA